MANFNSNLINLAIFWPRWYLPTHSSVSTRSTALGNGTSCEEASAGVFVQYNVFYETLDVIVTLLESGGNTNRLCFPLGDLTWCPRL